MRSAAPVNTTESATPSSRTRASSSARASPSPTRTRRSWGTAGAARVCVHEILEALQPDQPPDSGGDHVLLVEAQSAPDSVGCRLRRPRSRRRRRRRARRSSDRRAPSRRHGRGGRRSVRSPRGCGRTTSALPAPIARDRSETATSDPCRLITSGSPCAGAACAPIGPFGTTQCDVDEVERRRPRAAPRGTRRGRERRRARARRAACGSAPRPASDSENPHGVHDRRGE